MGVIAAQLWGSIAALVALGLAAIYLPLILVGGAVMSEPLFDVFMLASLAAVLAYRALTASLRAGRCWPASSAASPRSPAPRP